MKSKGKEQITRNIVKTIKVMLKDEKRDPIMMKDKQGLRVDSEGTEVETTTMEIETSQINLKKDMRSNTETENKQIDTLSLEISGTRSSIRQKKGPKSMSSDFLW
jgi:hypothetical protein